ncbi:neutral amino acid transporter 9-like isoform X1 [Apostichopus japonicus]|uniref:neutral amino acid transporter 9-like isoform X1 n=1 Tax=Stichopus japonicus TaxID=307972 RepID=UPI003AB155E0
MMDPETTRVNERTGLLDEQLRNVNSSPSDMDQGKEEDQSENGTGQNSKRRKPFHYSSIPTYIQDEGRVQTPIETHTAANYSRYRYYSKLGHHQDSTLAIPDHVLPSYIFTVNVPFQSAIRDSEGKQNSLVTIFSIWNTMMGTSLLSIPWAIHQAGLAMGLFLLVAMAGITLYTCYRVVQSISKEAGSAGMMEFSDVCRSYLGRWGEIISIIFSLIALFGAMIVYWVLMSNFLFSTVSFIRGEIDDTMEDHNGTSVRCDLPAFTESSVNATSDVFDKVWSKTHTVPFFLLLFIAPLINFKSPTFFTKFNALGTLSVAFLLIFITIKASEWGINIDFANQDAVSYVSLFSWRFPAFSGLLSLSYFIHNAVASIMRAQRHPQHNARDLTIAYILVAVTYTFVGLLFYITFPEKKDCIKDNLLDNFYPSDILSFAARLFLLFQMITLFPLILYIIRVQVMDPIFKSAYPSVKHVFVLNALLLSICVVFAIFLPKIGVIIRFSGAFCGLAYIFTLPCLVYMIDLHRQGNLRWYHILFHGIIMALGVLNFIAQFIILLF